MKRLILFFLLFTNIYCNYECLFKTGANNEKGYCNYLDVAVKSKGLPYYIEEYDGTALNFEEIIERDFKDTTKMAMIYYLVCNEEILYDLKMDFIIENNILIVCLNTFADDKCDRNYVTGSNIVTVMKDSIF